ncbi:hypothetical protein [Paraglaciecola arctica]|uniref:hypothetical protein n=1 Tax=Paraglaciecola arctica TaxID=1128911 RepID=UPI001C06CEA8|nr:hypothetical protein [Paraglaciecola arctica]MBU3003653.1 hypothetical protein [Paraglaciecola arctica]
MSPIKQKRSGVAIYLALIGLSTFKIVGFVLGAILGALIAFYTTEFSSPPFVELAAWCITFSLLGLFIGVIADMQHSGNEKRSGDVGSTDPKFSAPDSGSDGGGGD